MKVIAFCLFLYSNKFEANFYKVVLIICKLPRQFTNIFLTCKTVITNLHLLRVE